MLSFRSLKVPSLSDWLDLFQDARVKKHMPLSESNIGEKWIQNWIARKEMSSKMTPFEIYSIWNDDNFAGWGGIQADEENFEVAIVLKPEYWGFGHDIYGKFIKDFELSGVTQPLLIYLPLSRGIKGIKNRFEFDALPNVKIDGIEFQVLKICN